MTSPARHFCQPSLSANEISGRLLEMANEMAWALSIDGRQVLYANPSAAAMLRVSPELLSSLDWMQVVHADDQPELGHNLAAIGETKSFVQDFRILRDDGDEAWIKARFQLIDEPSVSANIPDQPRPKFIGVTARDLTRRLDAERQLEESQAIYRTLVESLPINVFRKDLDGKIVFANQRYCDELGKSLSQLVGKTDFDLFPDMAVKYRKDDAWALETGLPFHDIEIHPHGDDVMYVEVLKAPVKDATGRNIGIQGMFWDVTTRKKAEQALLQAKEAAEAHSRSKSDFLANVSHEIRTPLNGIIGITELLFGSVREKEQREYLEMIQNSSDSLLTLINEILDFSKIEAGKIQLQSKRFLLRDSLGDTIRSLAVRAHAKELELIVNFDHDVPEQIVGDLDRLRQVLVNLVGNAIKFTHRGEIELRVSLVKLTEDKATIQFSVRDTGIGIPEDNFESIFVEFEQVDSSSTRKYGGTGLGLSIAARLVALMGGKLGVESELSVGSRFSFTADFHYQASPVDLIGDALNGLKVLLVVPNTAQRKSLECMLKYAHLSFTSVDSVDGGINAVQESMPLDAIVCDADLNQRALMRLFEHARTHNKKIPALVLTRVIADPISEELARSKFVDEILIKPVKQVEFLASIGSIAGRMLPERDSAAAASSIHEKPNRPLKVLLVEDNVVNQKLAIGLLKKGGHQVSVADNGRIALQVYQRDLFDLVLLDIQMPEMDGYETCRHLRQFQSESGITIPIIALTAHASPEDRVRCLEAGMDEYLAKPIRPDKLFGMIEKLTGHISKVGAGEQPIEEKNHYVDWQHAFETVGGDRNLLVELLHVFIADQGRMLAAIESAIRAGNEKDLRINSHALKGALNHLGGREPARHAAQLETAAKNSNLLAAEEVFDQLKQSLADVLQEMSKFLDAK